MRQDLAKLMVERPRGGGRIRIHRRKHNQKSAWVDGDAPSRGSMSRTRGTKWQSEYFAPLIRILRSKRGVLWDEVYSEIAAQIRPTNVVQKHVLDHLFDYVITESWLEAGRPFGMLYWGHSIRLDRPTQRRDLFYVCPRTRQLKEMTHKRRQSRAPSTERTPHIRIAGPRLQFRQIKGIWYAFELKTLSSNAPAQQGATDCLFKVLVGDLRNSAAGRKSLFDAYGCAYVYAASKRQLGKKEIRGIERLPKALKSMEMPNAGEPRKPARKD